MNEENRILTLQNKIVNNKKVSDAEIALLTSQKTRAINLLGFYVFEEKLKTDTLSDRCLEVYNMNNIDNTRFDDIMELKESFKLSFDETIIPVEVKFIIEELI